MDFLLTPEHTDIVGAVRSLATRFTDEYWAECDDSREFPWDFYRAFADAGWLSIAMPKEYGGGGLGIFEASLVVEEIAASGAAMNGCSTMHLTIFALNLLAKHGSEELCREILPQAATGKIHVCFAVTEPDAGSDISRISTIARRSGDSYVISGRKVWITNADQAREMVLVCRTAPAGESARPTDGISIFVVDMNTAGIALAPIAKLGRNAVASFEVSLTDVRVPADRRIGEEGSGFGYLMDAINPERILLAHEAVGIGRAALARGLRYAKERVVFGRPIGKNQGVAFPLAEAHVRLEAAILMARHAAWRYDHRLPVGAQANMAKWLCAEAGFFAADQALQTHGGMGYAREYHVERYFREARLMRLAPLSQEMALNYVCTHVLGLPKSY